MQTNNTNNNSNNNNDNDDNNNNNNNNNNSSGNDVIVKPIKNAESKYFLLLPELSLKLMGLLKREKKIVFYFFIKKQIKTANQCFLIAQNVLVIKKKTKQNKATTSKQRKTKEKINK